MGLRDNAQKALEGFDAKTEKPQTGFEVLPDGDYYVAIEDITHFVTKNGYESLRVSVSVTEGEKVGKVDNNLYNLEGGGNIPESITNTAIQTIDRLANAAGVSLTDDDWEDYDTLATAFMEAKGLIVLMHFSSQPNKKKPAYPYKSYDFEPAEQPTEIEIKDDDVPF